MTWSSLVWSNVPSILLLHHSSGNYIADLLLSVVASQVDLHTFRTQTSSFQASTCYPQTPTFRPGLCQTTMFQELLEAVSNLFFFENLPKENLKFAYGFVEDLEALLLVKQVMMDEWWMMDDDDDDDGWKSSQFQTVFPCQLDSWTCVPGARTNNACSA